MSKVLTVLMREIIKPNYITEWQMKVQESAGRFVDALVFHQPCRICHISDPAALVHLHYR
jgi:hypothetical protein